MFMREIKLPKVALQKTVLFLILISGIIYIQYTWVKFKNSQTNEALQIARSIEATFPKEELKELEAKPTDIDKPQYQVVKKTLKSIIHVNPKARFAYIFTKRNGKIYFFADSEPAESKDCSPPGQEYTEADEASYNAFNTGKEIISPPYTDRWGTWVSALIPIKDETTGKIIAVYGMDFDAKSWINSLLVEVIKSSVLIVLLLLAILFLFRIKDKNKILKQDIYKQKHAEQALVESEYRLRTIIEAEPECIKIVDAEGRLILMNPAGLSIIGADSMEQVTGQEVFKLISPEHRKAFIRMHKRVIAGESVQLEFKLEGLKGGHHWLETNAVPMEYHGNIVHLAHTRNITERKRAEELLKNSELFLKETQTIARLGTYVLSLENGTWSSSNILDVILGINADYDKSTLNWTSIVHPEWRQKILNYFRNEVLVRKCKFDKEYKIIRKHDNEERWVHGLGEVFFNEENQPIKMIGTIQDITERKHIEEELIIAKEKAEESDRLKSAFLTNMSHEIRTPMNGILGFAELLKEPNLTGEEQQECINIIEKSGARMLNIINDIIDISKIESGLMKVSLSETNINEQIEYIYTFFKPEFDGADKQLSFKNTLPSESVLIKTDREKIYAILTNLVKNAIKFTPKGSIEVGYNLKPAEPKTEHMSGTLDQSFELEFFVKDTGNGIRQEQLEIIFERFRQGSETLTKNYEGAGLGLSISKAFVEMLGGKIWVESELGKGSIFYFTIPYNGGQEVMDGIKIDYLVDAKEKQSQKLKILIAEDDEVSAKFLEKKLEFFCKEILKVGNGVEVVEACRNNPDIDLVLMDIQMPEMDGYETTRQIRQFNKKVIIIAQTAYALMGDREKAIDAGCNDYISKPVKKDQLMALLQKYFKKMKNIDPNYN
jgi:PAS domain S-box-containing protein